MMQFISENDIANLLCIDEACNKILLYMNGIRNVSEFEDDIKTFDAVLMNIVIIGEAVSRISDVFKENNPLIEWLKIKAFRNIVVHDYFGIDVEEFWQINKIIYLSYRGM